MLRYNAVAYTCNSWFSVILRTLTTRLSAFIAVTENHGLQSSLILLYVDMCAIYRSHFNTQLQSGGIWLSMVGSDLMVVTLSTRYERYTAGDVNPNNRASQYFGWHSIIHVAEHTLMFGDQPDVQFIWLRKIYWRISKKN